MVFLVIQSKIQICFCDLPGSALSGPCFGSKLSSWPLSLAHSALVALASLLCHNKSVIFPPQSLHICFSFLCSDISLAICKAWPLTYSYLILIVMTLWKTEIPLFLSFFFHRIFLLSLYYYRTYFTFTCPSVVYLPLLEYMLQLSNYSGTTGCLTFLSISFLI